MTATFDDAVFDYILQSTAESAVRYLELAWRLEHGAAPSDFEADLELLAPIFQSHVTGTRVREHAKNLAPIPAARPHLPDPAFIPVDEERGMVTPEGRAIIEIARDPTRPLPEVLETVARFYGDSLRGWIRKSVLTGLLPLPSAGFAVFLLINGSIGPERSMRFPNDTAEETELAGVVMEVASIFSTSVGGPPVRQKERHQLRTSWVISQAVRHLGSCISRGERDGGVASIWIDEGREEELIRQISVSVRARGEVTPSMVAAAFDRAEHAYDAGRSLLGAWGISHERRRQTDRWRDALLDAVESPAPS